MAIASRIRANRPVVLMGECGCGKTYLISYIAAWVGALLVTLDIHGGTTEPDVAAAFVRAEALIADPEGGAPRNVFVFLDECNACAHMGLLTEVICRHSQLTTRCLGDRGGDPACCHRHVSRPQPSTD